MNSLLKIKNKIITVDDYLTISKEDDFKNKKIVFTNGCFDLLHRGHVEYLSQASDKGDILIVGLNTDASVQRLKGKHRPIVDEYARALVMASLLFVDFVIFFDEDTPYQLIKKIQPDILVKGSDYDENSIVGADIVKAKGGKVITIELTPNYSTSTIEKKIRDNV
ncbi:MAG TPA: D-glycero-beta-D-manno-heptose 1-phosphate adenylyltransferase [Bacteroidales bacterium]|jgi:rfaE bifunctional protein nucleotidyltransferase chain/domain|nr:D-glycero-beta-D-manno-heptose 1-phosphate adenylyltransferase [Bacteroidales bacterium]HOF16923.1 D-glycero-beta-D-manno-heptose 1-phosphate adenylyltransferase [Bacteroidales bacterium]HOR82486.1 D-glycero-beta-D-manno-heptose 1-phosphate adenylyltransferase [Bacteroidales bacterium]HPJ92015.1 D-glycero-beta-D-manno-heptose 1-phosphate adenylyltransferase [Bacteroidales bacterium]